MKNCWNLCRCVPWHLPTLSFQSINEDRVGLSLSKTTSPLGSFLVKSGGRWVRGHLYRKLFFMWSGGALQRAWGKSVCGQCLKFNHPQLPWVLVKAFALMSVPKGWKDKVYTVYILGSICYEVVSYELVWLIVEEKIKALATDKKDEFAEGLLPIKAATLKKAPFPCLFLRKHPNK